jgi:hypothetical protein
MYPLPGAVFAPLPKVVIDDPPGRQVMGQQAPGAASAQQIENAVEHLPLGVFLRAAARLGLGHEMLDQLPCLVGEIGRVRLACLHAPYRIRSLLAHASFLDTLLDSGQLCSESVFRCPVRLMP